MGKNGSGMDQYRSALFGTGPYLANNNVNRERIINRMLMKVMIELAVNRFKWEGLPDSIDPRFLEMTLFYKALAIYYFDEGFNKELVVQGAGMSYLNVFDNPVSFNVIAPGAKIDVAGSQTNVQTPRILSAYDPARHKELPENERRKKAIPIWANALRYPEIDVVSVYASRLAAMDRTIEINSSNARHNKVLKATPNTQLSIVNANRSMEQGETLQVTGPLEDMQFIDVVDLGVDPDSFDKLHMLRTRTWNECMGLLGIDNSNQDKKERLVSAEVGANDSQTDSMRYVSLNARRQACGYIKDVFGTNVSVDFNTEIEQRAKEAQEQSDPLTQDSDE